MLTDAETFTESEGAANEIATKGETYILAW